MSKLKNDINKVIVYQSKSGKIEFRGDVQKDTIWGTQQQIAQLFGTQRPAITKHLNNIFKDQELQEKSVSSILEHTAKDGKLYKTKFYNLDAILSVGYRVNSKQATQFRIWATKTLKQHLLEGYTINKKQLAKNYQKFQETLENIKTLLPQNKSVPAQDTLELVKAFSHTWFSLEAYDSQKFPTQGVTKKQVVFTAEELNKALVKFKQDLMKKKQATDLFGQEKSKNAVAGIVGNIFQSFGGKDLYPTVEEKSAHLLYFTVKNHPFTDGNKRSGAFAFIWFLKKALSLPQNLTPPALTALTLLVAESNPKDKDKIIGLILLLLKGK